MRYIYKLIDPITKEIRYVGQTDNLKRRFNDHLSSSTNINSVSYNTHKSCWIRKLINNGYESIMAMNQLWRLLIVVKHLNNLIY